MTTLTNTPEYSVSEIAARVKRVVEDNFGYVRVRGEISKATVNAASGHCYLTLKDDKAVLDAVCWKGTMARLTHKPQAGLEVVAIGKLTTYPGRSNYQLVIEALEPAGIGALMAMLEERKKKLSSEGLFDSSRKKPLPFLPEVIGIITSPTGAVIRDMLHRLSDRFPRRVLLWPVAVQGAGAAEQIAAAISGFNQPPNPQSLIPNPDLIIVARGGGSIEDLWAFNEEIVVRAAANSRIPLISAVGHETDTTLIDYAADMRAPTPTGAAEFAVPVRDDLRYSAENFGARMAAAVRVKLTGARERLDAIARALPRPQQLVSDMAQRLDDIDARLHTALPRAVALRTEKLNTLIARLSPRALLMDIERRRANLNGLSGLLESLNVSAVLARGFAIVRDSSGHVITRAAHTQAKQTLRLQFADGDVTVHSPEAAKS
jgi:exodeoxyribonuclease VII large subunit